MLKTLMIRSALLAFACALSFAAHAYAADPKRIDVPAGDLGAALQALAKQSGVEFVYQSDQLKGLRTKGVTGEFTPEDAVTKLLEGTPLTFRKDSSGAMLIALPRLNPLSSGEDREGPAKREGKGIRLAQANNPSPGTGEGKGEGNSSPGTGEEGARDSGRVREEKEGQELPAPEETGKAIPEILVKGGRSLNADIRRTEDASQPYVVFDSEEIQRSQTVNLEDFLRTRLPMNAARGSFSQTEVQSGISVSNIDLRGMGADQTLILVDGRRMPNITHYNIYGVREVGQPDVNGIPLSAIERIEILPSTASGIFGGGATGGVINIVLKHDYTGVELLAGYDNTFDTDAARRKVDLHAGLNLEGGRTSVLAALSYSSSDPLLGHDRDFAQRSRALLLRNNPAAFYDTFNPPVGGTVNIRSRSGDLVLDDGTPLNSMFTHVPRGYQGGDSDGGAALVPNAGQYNLSLPDDINGGRQSLVNNPTVRSAMFNFRRSMTNRLQMFVDLSVFENDGETQFALTSTGVVLAGSSPINPFQNPIEITYAAPNVLGVTRNTSQTVRASGGVLLQLPHAWAGEASYGWNLSRSEYEGISEPFDYYGRRQVLFGAPNPLAPDPLNRPLLDLLQDGNTVPVPFELYRLNKPTTKSDPFDTVLKNATLRLSGPVLDLPGGPATLSVLLESREEELKENFVQSTTFVVGAGGVRVDSPLYEFRPGISQKVRSVYAEARTPLISAANAMSWVKELELQVAGRHDDYETASPDTPSVSIGSARDAPLPAIGYGVNRLKSTDFTLGVRYMPVADLVLRASFGTGFVPAQVGDLRQSISVSDLPSSYLTDPRRGGQPVGFGGSWTNLLSGNPDLKPEESESVSAGIILMPHAAPGLRLSIDYTRIKKTDEISFFSSGQFLLDNESLFQDRIQRAPLDPADAALGYTGGRILVLNQSLANLAHTVVEAYDFQLDQDFTLAARGNLHFYALATWQRRFAQQARPDTPVFDPTGFSDGPLEWRGNIGLTWEKGPLSVGWNAQYYDSYNVSRLSAFDEEREQDALNQGSDTIASQIYHDLRAAYRFEHPSGFLSAVFAGSELSAGIQNVFDKSPPILAGTTGIGGYSTYGDPRLRRYSVSFRKQF